MRPRTRRLKSLSVVIGRSFGQATGNPPPSGDTRGIQRLITSDPGVFPPLPHEDPCWGRADEVGRGSSALSIVHHPGGRGKRTKNHVLTLDQAAGVLPRPYVRENDVAW